MCQTEVQVFKDLLVSSIHYNKVPYDRIEMINTLNLIKKAILNFVLNNLYWVSNVYLAF